MATSGGGAGTRVRSRGLDAGITGWQRVSGRLIAVELVSVALAGVVGLGVLTLILFVSGVLHVAVVTGIVLGVAGVIWLVRLALVPRRIHSIGYVLREDDLVFRRGILFSRLVAVPYGRMQLVDVNRGPLARLLGLSELRLVTAAATTGVTVPGLPEQQAAELRDTLVARAEERRVGL